MQPCEDCKALAGWSSKEAPHSNLSPGPVSGFGKAGGQLEATEKWWKCTECQGYMLQGFEHAEPPNEWRIAERMPPVT